MTPADRIRHMVDWKPPDPKQVGPCGGFSAQYLCMCDYYGLPFREEVAWDVDTIYFSHDSHELCLQDFEHLDHRDLTCISKLNCGVLGLPNELVRNLYYELELNLLLS